MNAETNPGTVGGAISNEPVAIAGVVRALVYSLLGTRGLDASTLTLIVVLVESVVSFAVRRLVTPVGRTAPPAAADAAGDQQHPAVSA